MTAPLTRYFRRKRLKRTAIRLSLSSGTVFLRISKKSLSFLLEIMGRADYTDTRSIIRALEKYTPDYDLSQGEKRGLSLLCAG